MRVIIQHVDTSCVKVFIFSRVTRPVSVGVVLLSLYIGVIFKMLLNEILELLCTVQTKRQIDSFFKMLYSQMFHLKMSSSVVLSLT